MFEIINYSNFIDLAGEIFAIRYEGMIRIARIATPTQIFSATNCHGMSSTGA